MFSLIRRETTDDYVTRRTREDEVRRVAGIAVENMYSSLTSSPARFDALKECTYTHRIKNKREDRG